MTRPLSSSGNVEFLAGAGPCPSDLHSDLTERGPAAVLYRCHFIPSFPVTPDQFLNCPGCGNSASLTGSHGDTLGHRAQDLIPDAPC